MRKTQTTWRRCWSRKWVRKFTAISLVVAAATCELTMPFSWAAGGPNKKAPRQKASEKIARKLDESNAKNVNEEVPKTVPDDHPLKPCVDRAEASLQAISTVKDYSAVLFKTEMVQNKLVSHNMVTKIRHEPFSVYLKYEQPYAGREVIYVDGQNKGKLLAHDTGLRSLAGTVTLLTLLYGWYSPIGRGDRFMLSLWMPLVYCFIAGAESAVRPLAFVAALRLIASTSFKIGPAQFASR